MWHQAITHRRSQLKQQKLRVGSCTEEVLEWFNYSHASAHPGCEVSCQGIPNRPASSLCSCFVEASPTMEKAVVALESRPTRSLVNRPPQCSLLAVREFCAVSEERCKRGYRRTCAKLCCWMSWRLVAAIYMSSAHLHSILYA